MEYKDAGTLHDEIEQLLGKEIDGVTVRSRSGEIDVEGVTDDDMTQIRQNINPRREQGADFTRGENRRAEPDQGQSSGGG